MLTNFSPPGRAVPERVGGDAGLRQVPDGTAVIDVLLSELNPHDTTLLDAALDLRTLAAERQDAAACLQQLFRVRALLSRRHYIAFQQVHAWARRALQVEVRSDRGAPWIAFEIPATSTRTEEVANTARACLAAGDFVPSAVQVRFVFCTESIRPD